MGILFEPHNCLTPADVRTPEGTVWECDECSSRWRLERPTIQRRKTEIHRRIEPRIAIWSRLTYRDEQGSEFYQEDPRHIDVLPRVKEGAIQPGSLLAEA